MPPRVARQWHISWAPRSAQCGLLFSTQIQRQSRFLARLYTQSSGNNGATLDLSTVNSAIIIPHSTSSAPEDLIRHIQPVTRRRLTQDRFAVFFVTPAFAHWLLDDQIFLQKALRQTYKHALQANDVPYALHTLCAVVDKLPAPKAIHNNELLETEAATRVEQPPVSENGHEGIAYATLGSDDSVLKRNSPVDTESASISFINAARGDKDEYADTLRLPLANTVFQTGTTNTMTYSTWVKKKGEHDIVLKKKHQVTQHGIKLHGGGPTNKYISALSVPLIPVTFPRQVDASMGNILRRVIGPDGTSVTASKELENIVPRYFKARGELSQPTTVWAMVIPTEFVSYASRKTLELLGRQPAGDGIATPDQDEFWEAFWKHDPPRWNDLVPAALASGARLHRVLSGGGGWGKKAGLLSLDPVATTQINDSHLSGNPDTFGDLSSALHKIVQDGDHIQFFMSSANSRDAMDQDSQLVVLEDLAKVSNFWTWELGTIPSSIDSFPGGTWQHSAPASNEAFVFRHCFGALTERGLTLHRQLRLDPHGALLHTTESKLDVPYSRFFASDAGAEENPQVDLIFSFLETETPSHDNTSVSVPRPYPDVKAAADVGLLRKNRSGTGLPAESSEHTPSSSEKLVIRKVAARPSPSAQLPGFIRHVKITDEIDYCADKLRQSQKAVQQLTYECRLVLNAILRFNNRPMDLAVKRFVTDPSRSIKPDFTSSRNWMDTISMSANSLELNLQRVQQGIADIPKQANDEAFSGFLARLQHISDTTIRLRNDLSRILNFVMLRTRLSTLANNSALAIYQLHTRLRWRLGAMIHYRQRLKNLGPRTRPLPFLEKKLIKLRAYGSNLFLDRQPMSVQHIRQCLLELESRSERSRDLRLSRPANPGERIAALSVTRQTSADWRLLRTEDGVKVHAFRIRYPQQNVQRVRGNRYPRRVLAGRVPIRKQPSFGGESIPLVRGDDAVDGKRGVASRRQRSVVDDFLGERQKEETRRRSKMALVDMVKGWLGSGLEGETMRTGEEKRFWEKANALSSPPAMDDPFGKGSRNDC